NYTDESEASDGPDLYTGTFECVEDIEWTMVDAVLVSNSQSLIMLPYITEMQDFRGKVLTSDPVLRVLIDDLFAEAENLSSSVLDSAKKGRRWLLRYTKDQAANALSKVQTLAYHEYVDLFGLIKVKCVSAGYEIGSSNWVLKTDAEKLPMDFSEFSDIDVLIIGAVNTSDCLPFDVAMGYFKTITVQTLARGSHVMLPTLPSGLIYHLLEAVAKCPCLFISTQAKASLAYANASGEWLATDRESALYAADSPFLFDTWIRNHHLAALTSLHSTPGQVTSEAIGRKKRDSAWVEGGLWSSYPTVFLSGHPSCRLGPAVHLIRALSLGSSRQRPPQQQQQQQQYPNTNSLILVQSDEFCAIVYSSAEFKVRVFAESRCSFDKPSLIFVVPCILNDGFFNLYHQYRAMAVSDAAVRHESLKIAVPFFIVKMFSFDAACQSKSSYR
ncbi:hypothetical protein TSMEX_004310, partial [Taenia solium]